MGISSTVLDFYDDNSGHLMSKLATPAGLANVPMSVLAPDEHARLGDSEFGLIVLTKQAHVLRKFPVNDSGNAWLSAQYFQQTHDKMAFPARFVAAKFIKEACYAYGVPSSPRVDAYAVRADEEIDSNVFVEGSESQWMLRKLAQREFIEKQASAVEMNAVINMPDDHFALIVSGGDGEVVRMYAMPDAAHVKVAAEYFDKYAMDLAPEYRHIFAVSVQRRAEETGVNLSNSKMLEKWASQSWNRNVHAHLEQRKSLLPRNQKACDILDKLAASIGDTDTSTMARALETFDTSTGLNRYYDRGLTDPYASVMDKAGSGWSAEVDGDTITEGDLRKITTSNKIAGYMGREFAAAFAKDPIAIFESLPMPEKHLIKQIVDGGA